VIERTFISLAVGIAAGVVVLLGSWLLVTAYTAIGWQVPVAAGFAVATAIWVIDFLTDELARRQKR